MLQHVPAVYQNAFGIFNSKSEAQLEFGTGAEQIGVWQGHFQSEKKALRESLLKSEDELIKVCSEIEKL